MEALGAGFALAGDASAATASPVVLAAGSPVPAGAASLVLSMFGRGGVAGGVALASRFRGVAALGEDDALGVAGSALAEGVAASPPAGVPPAFRFLDETVAAGVAPAFAFRGVPSAKDAEVPCFPGEAEAVALGVLFGLGVASPTPIFFFFAASARRESGAPSNTPR